MLSKARIKQFWSKVDRSGGSRSCWKWQGFTTRDGHGQVKVRSIRPAPMYTHQVAWLIAGRDLPEDLVIRHTCDTAACCNPKHLVLGTQLENMRDKVERGRSSTGEKNGRAKLTADQVREILRRAGESRIGLAREFGVVPAVIHNIIRRRTWRHVS